jgi:uncharacterized OB-fold protein
MTLPTPPILPSPDAAPFWEAARRHELVLPYCEAGDGYFFYPRTACPTCGSRDVGWRPASGRGRIHTFTIQPASRVPGYADVGPFVTVVVELEEGPRMMSILVDVQPDPEHVRCDLPVEVAFLDQPDGESLPVFRLVEGA